MPNRIVRLGNRKAISSTQPRAKTVREKLLRSRQARRMLVSSGLRSIRRRASVRRIETRESIPKLEIPRTSEMLPPREFTAAGVDPSTGLVSISDDLSSEISQVQPIGSGSVREGDRVLGLPEEGAAIVPDRGAEIPDVEITQDPDEFGFEGKVGAIVRVDRFVRRVQASVLFTVIRDKGSPIKRVCPKWEFAGSTCVPTSNPHAEYTSLSACLSDPRNRIYLDAEGNAIGNGRISDEHPDYAGPNEGYPDISSNINLDFDRNDDPSETGMTWIFRHIETGNITSGIVPNFGGDIGRYLDDPEWEIHTVVGTVVFHRAAGYQPEERPAVGTTKTVQGRGWVVSCSRSANSPQQPAGVTRCSAPSEIGYSITATFQPIGPFAPWWRFVSESTSGAFPNAPPVGSPAGEWPSRSPDSEEESQIARQYWIGGHRQEPEMVAEFNESEPSEGYLVTYPDGTAKVIIKVGREIRNGEEEWCKIKKYKSQSRTSWLDEFAQDLALTPSESNVQYPCASNYINADNVTVQRQEERVVTIDLNQSVQSRYGGATSLITELGRFFNPSTPSTTERISAIVQERAIQNLAGCQLSPPVNRNVLIWPLISEDMVDEVSNDQNGYPVGASFTIEFVSPIYLPPT